MDMNQGQGPQQIQIDPSQTDGIICTAPKCNSEFFMPMFMLRRISALLSPSGREEVIQVPVMVCGNCGKPYDQNAPEEGLPDADADAKPNESMIITK